MRVQGNVVGPRLRSANETITLDLAPGAPGHWSAASGTFHGRAGDRITLEAPAGGHRDYHVWISR